MKSKFFQPMKSGIQQTFTAKKVHPYNRVKLTNGEELLEVMVAGYADTGIEIKKTEHNIEITGIDTGVYKKSDYIHCGIGSLSFDLMVSITPTTYIKKVDMYDGILYIVLVNPPNK